MKTARHYRTHSTDLGDGTAEVSTYDLCGFDCPADDIAGIYRAAVRLAAALHPGRSFFYSDGTAVVDIRQVPLLEEALEKAYRRHQIDIPDDIAALAEEVTFKPGAFGLHKEDRA